MATMNRDRTMRFWEFMLFTISRNCGGSITGGPRTPERNEAKGGHDQSKHLWKHGHGMACDFMFENETMRDIARNLIEEEGYHTYVGENYAPEQLHVQGVPYGWVLDRDYS